MGVLLHQDLRNSADIGDPLTRSIDHEVSKLFNEGQKINNLFFKSKDTGNSFILFERPNFRAFSPFTIC